MKNLASGKYRKPSTSLWGRELKFVLHNYLTIILIRRPPCEVVSWNTKTSLRTNRYRLSTSLWGRELKYRLGLALLHRKKSTSLWGRELKCLWACNYNETLVSTSLWGRELKWLQVQAGRGAVWSTSLWGRELKYALFNVARSVMGVDLLVRSWVEIHWLRRYGS